MHTHWITLASSPPTTSCSLRGIFFSGICNAFLSFVAFSWICDWGFGFLLSFSISTWLCCNSFFIFWSWFRSISSAWGILMECARSPCWLFFLFGHNVLFVIFGEWFRFHIINWFPFRFGHSIFLSGTVHSW